MAGYQFPAKYPWTRLKEITICLLPVMALMWLLTAGCYMATIPKVSLLAALVIGASVTCTDPVLSQAVAKGPFSDQFVARPLREIISAEAGLNDGFCFPFLMLAIYLLRHANGGSESFDIPDAAQAAQQGHRLLVRAGEVGRLGGGLGEAMQKWFLETWLYFVVLGGVYGAVVGYGAGKAIKYALKRCVTPLEFGPSRGICRGI
jgi:sodium/hydrogen antiporter